MSYSLNKEKLDSILRVDHAGETAAAKIYDGQLAILKNNPVGENNKYVYSKPKPYTFNFKRSPDQTVSELFGHGVDAKWANILYIGQIPDKDIQAIEKLPSAYNKVRTAINKEDKMFFKNEMFSIKKIR